MSLSLTKENSRHKENEEKSYISSVVKHNLQNHNIVKAAKKFVSIF